MRKLIATVMMVGVLGACSVEVPEPPTVEHGCKKVKDKKTGENKRRCGVDVNDGR